MSKYIVKMQVPIPWNNRVIESGVENLKQISLPVYGNITFNHTSEMKNLTINLAPFQEQEVTINFTFHCF